MKYAPVIIPTLNRYEHLKKCVDSLRKSNLAKSTELYISLDYPPLEKYEKGYKEVKQYLQQGIEGFQQVHVFYQKENLGAVANAKFLYDVVLEKYEVYIFTEDDNVFSTNFLDYVNICLSKFAKDKEIFAICGYSYPIQWKGNESALIQSDNLFPAWGYASWKDRWRDLQTFQKKDIQSYLREGCNAYKLFRKSKRLFVEAVQIVSDKHYLALNEEKELEYIDSVVGIYLSVKKKKIILPRLSKVRNMGNDGSGLHCEDMSLVIEEASENDLFHQSIDQGKDFHFEEVEIINISIQDEKKLNQYMRVSRKELFKSWIIWLLFRYSILPRKER